MPSTHQYENESGEHHDQHRDKDRGQGYICKTAADKNTLTPKTESLRRRVKINRINIQSFSSSKKKPHNLCHEWAQVVTVEISQIRGNLLHYLLHHSMFLKHQDRLKDK